MKKIIYTCRDCPACERVTDFVQSNKLDVEIVNISEGGKNAPWIAVFPAYYIDEKLMAYGEDIITKLSAVA